MTKQEYSAVEAYMIAQMQDSAHDKHHLYRVLNFALDIASYVEEKDLDVLIAACLLHDIGREKQAINPACCHAEMGSEMAYGFLLSRNWPVEKARHVKACISTHRYRSSNPPQSIEAKILFDADKLEACGAMGIARTLIYSGQVSQPLYALSRDGNIVVDVKDGEGHSFIQEFHYKLKSIYNAFYTERAKEVALERQKAAIDFYNNLFTEITANYDNGLKRHAVLLFGQN